MWQRCVEPCLLDPIPFLCRKSHAAPRSLGLHYRVQKRDFISRNFTLEGEQPSFHIPGKWTWHQGWEYSTCRRAHRLEPVLRRWLGHAKT